MAYLSRHAPMPLDRWYRQRFGNGDVSYFFAERILKNGNVQGTSFFVDIERPRARPKGKRESVWARELWEPVDEAEVPVDRFRL
jgi:hypothetical protein